MSVPTKEEMVKSVWLLRHNAWRVGYLAFNEKRKEEDKSSKPEADKPEADKVYAQIDELYYEIERLRK